MPIIYFDYSLKKLACLVHQFKEVDHFQNERLVVVHVLVIV